MLSKVEKHRLANKKWLLANPEKKALYMKRWRSANQAKLNEYSRYLYSIRRDFIENEKSRPCTDCGVQYDTWIMEFDHLPGTQKSFNLAHAHRHSEALVQAEIAKCEVVCANCHKQRTYQRMYAKS